MRSDFGQRVMAAAGVEHRDANYCAECGCSRKIHDCDGACGVFECPCCEFVDAPVYPEPLTPEGFVALWDALEARGWYPHVVTLRKGFGYRAFMHDYINSPIDAVGESRATALLEAAAQALGVVE